MEATTLNKKKGSVKKGKLKKTIKNVLCRPDPVFWPVCSSEEEKDLNETLLKYKIEIPEFKKLHWSVLKLMPKESRPKPPKLRKVDGLIFGLSDCTRSISRGQCVGVILDAFITPQLLVQHVIDACENAKIPVLCLKDLKSTCQMCFGFPSCCIGITNDKTVAKLKLKIYNFGKICNIPNKETNVSEGEDEQEIAKEETNNDTKSSFTYLYRNSRTTRVFIPPSAIPFPSKRNKEFIGQNFIKLPDEAAVVQKIDKDRLYKKMIVKRISNNPNRKKNKS